MKNFKENINGSLKVWHVFLSVATIVLVLVGTLFAGAQLFEKRIEAISIVIDEKIIAHDQNALSHIVLRTEVQSLQTTVINNKTNLDSVYIRQQIVILRLDQIREAQAKIFKKLGIE